MFVNCRIKIYDCTVIEATVILIILYCVNSRRVTTGTVVGGECAGGLDDISGRGQRKNTSHE